MDSPACTKIAGMQLFYELKQKFPFIPDQIVTDCIQQNFYDREVCEETLRTEYEKHRSQIYPHCIAEKMSKAERGRPRSLPLPKTTNGRHKLQSLDRECHRRRSDRMFGSVKNIEIQAEPNVFVSDLQLRLRSDSSCERTSLRVKYKKDGSHSAPCTPIYAHKSIGDHKRQPCTSADLSVRPSSNKPQPPINIRAKEDRLEYSCCGYDCKQGFRNALKISISDGGASPSPTTTCTTLPSGESSLDGQKVHKSSDDDANHKLEEQIKCKAKLESELVKDKRRLEEMKTMVAAMEKDLEKRKSPPVISEKVLRLRAEVRALQIACHEIINQIDLMTDNPVPLGETDEKFYINVTKMQSESNNNNNHLSQHSGNSDSWTCRMCTFRNHPMLPKCEQCEMVRIDLSNALTNILRSNSSHQLPIQNA